MQPVNSFQNKQQFVFVLLKMQNACSVLLAQLFTHTSKKLLNIQCTFAAVYLFICVMLFEFNKDFY